MSSSNSRSRYPSSIANGRFEITRRLGAGCFGDVFRAVDAETKKEVAVKFESIAASAPQLEHEASILNALRRPVQQQGFAEYFYFGKEGKSYCVIMELLGKNLEDHVQLCGGRLTIKSAVLCAEQALQRIEYLHSKGIVHRDIKPENFAFGAGAKRHHLYLIDFGLSDKYYDKRHARIRTRLPLTGTARYASTNAHRGIGQSRRDDLESIGHMLMYLLRGSLPWSGLEAKTKEEKYKRIMEVKETTPLKDLCEGYPSAFERYLQYTRDLGFTQRPDYAMLRKLFGDLRDTISREEGRQVEDHDFEWNEGKDLGQLQPLVPAASPSQPDDFKAARGPPRGLRCFFRRTAG